MQKSKIVKNLSKQLGRKEKKLSELMKEVEHLRMLSAEEVETFDETFSKESLTLIENEARAFKTSANNMQYSEELKSFAISLHFYSAQAYDYLRRYLHLPHADTLRRWASSYDVQPGFLGDVLTALKAQVAADKSMEDVCLMFDSMAIRKQVLYDQKTQKFVGYVNHGRHNISSQSDREATESLVLMIVGQRKFFKHPIAYFLVDKIDAKLQSTIITDGISLLTDAGFNVVAVVCDGAFSNQATATKMGCTLKKENLQCEIAHPTIPSKSVSMMFDACHLIKNVRNCFGELGVIKHGEDKIEWQFIRELHKIQLNSNLHLGNKLRGAHLDFIKNKMKVSLAVQTLSSSVATAIEFLRDDLHLPQFAGSEATCTFIRVFDKVFDLMNSTNKLAKGFKSPLTPDNFVFKKAEIADASHYIRALTDTTGKPLVAGRRKTGFVGFLASMQSVQKIAERLFAKRYSYVLTFRLSQDHLETFFGRIRRRGGWNNNPNVLQFQYALRALLQKNGVLASSRGNCTPFLDNTLCSQDGLEASTNSLAIDCTPLQNEKEKSLNKNHNYQQFLKVLCQPSPYHSDALYYISGYIARKMAEKIKCKQCVEHLAAKRMHCSSLPGAAAFTQRRDNEGLLYASSDMFSVISVADKVLRRLLVSDTAGPFRSVSESTVLKVQLEVTETLSSRVFMGLKEHRADCHFSSEDDHPTQIIKTACAIFCKTMLHHHGKLYTQRFIKQNNCSVRHKMNKTVLFLNQ